jgi:hypothetical protein
MYVAGGSGRHRSQLLAGCSWIEPACLAPSPVTRGEYCTCCSGFCCCCCCAGAALGPALPSASVAFRMDCPRHTLAAASGVTRPVLVTPAPAPCAPAAAPAGIGAGCPSAAAAVMAVADTVLLSVPLGVTASVSNTISCVSTILERPLSRAEAARCREGPNPSSAEAALLSGPPPPVTCS